MIVWLLKKTWRTLRTLSANLWSNTWRTLLTNLTYLSPLIRGFPDSSVGKESVCNAGDPGSIPGSGRSSGEGIGDPLQYSWASLVAQLVKNPPAMQETWVWSLGWEDPLEKGMLPTPIFWPGEFRGLSHRVAKSQTWLRDFHWLN